MDGEAGRRDYRKQDWCNPFHVIAPSWQKITLSLSGCRPASLNQARTGRTNPGSTAPPSI
jgi:hypothetical protein